MSITQRRSLDSNAIKLIAILAMTVDHIAWAVFPGYPRAALPLLMHHLPDHVLFHRRRLPLYA